MLYSDSFFAYTSIVNTYDNVRISGFQYALNLPWKEVEHGRSSLVTKMLGTVAWKSLCAFVCRKRFTWKLPESKRYHIPCFHVGWCGCDAWCLGMMRKALFQPLQIMSDTTRRMNMTFRHRRMQLFCVLSALFTVIALVITQGVNTPRHHALQPHHLAWKRKIW